MKRITAAIILISILITDDLSAGNSHPSNHNENGYPKGYYNRGPLPEKTAYLTFDDGPAE